MLDIQMMLTEESCFTIPLKVQNLQEEENGD